MLLLSYRLRRRWRRLRRPLCDMLFFRVLFVLFAALGVAAPLYAAATYDNYDTAVLQGLDKPNARVQTIEIAAGKEVSFGPLRIRVRACKKAPPEETPEAAAFVEIVDVRAQQKAGGGPLFSGWMFASSPALSALEHPIYDVWVLDCKKVETKPASPAAPKSSPKKAVPAPSATPKTP